MRIGIPALAGLSVLHGLVPPHPGPLAPSTLLHANLGVTLALGLLVAVPDRDRRRAAVRAASPAPWLRVAIVRRTPAPTRRDRRQRRLGGAASAVPGFGGHRWLTMLLPVVLMLAKALADLVDRRPGHRRAAASSTSSAPR